jgi:hypothetical protein
MVADAHVHDSPLSANGVNIGGGFFTVTPTQQVTISAYWDNFNCPSQAQFAWCVEPVGVAYIPTANVMVLSEAQCEIGCNQTRNALVGFDPAESGYGSPLDLNCQPGVPYFPGAGSDYFVLCWNETGGWALL